MEKSWQMKSSTRARRIPIKPPRGERGKCAERGGCERRVSLCDIYRCFCVRKILPVRPSWLAAWFTAHRVWHFNEPNRLPVVYGDLIRCRSSLQIPLLPPSQPATHIYTCTIKNLAARSLQFPPPPISPHTCSPALHKGFVPLFSLSYRQMGSVLSLP